MKEDIRPVSVVRYCGIFFLLLVCLFLFACKEENKYSSNSGEIQILDKNLFIPANWHYWRYEEVQNASNEAYKQLRFSINIETFDNIKPNYKESKTIDIEIRPLRAEFGEKYYWTEQDPVYNGEPSNCNSIKYNHQEFAVCQYKKNIRLNSSAYGGFSIQNKNTG